MKIKIQSPGSTKPTVGSTRLVRPCRGQIWAFGGPYGRQDRIKSVSRGAIGAWRMDGGKLAPLAQSTAMWVKWESRMATITVTHLWQNWVCILPNAELSGGGPLSDKTAEADSRRPLE